MTEFTFPLKPKTIKDDGQTGVFEIENLYPGYGLTIGNALRRALLSSLPGAAVTLVKIKGVQHEFSTISGVKEDVLEILLNLKKIRIKLLSEEPQMLVLSVKGEKKVTAKDIERNSMAEVVNPEISIATLTDKKSELEIALTVERGLGYVPAENHKKEKLSIGTISLDALFSPIKKVNYEVEDMRVGERTDYNLLRLTIETDGTIAPKEALEKASRILADHFRIISGLEKIDSIEENIAEEFVVESEEKEEKKSEKKSKKK